MATNLGLLHLDVVVGDSFSLKDKRRVIKGFKDRVRARFNVSIAEVDALDRRRQAVLAVAKVGNDRRYVEGALQQVINTAEIHRGLVVVSTDIEWL
jgi:uncharacterized protein YlxP (DUF503 family)